MVLRRELKMEGIFRLSCDGLMGFDKAGGPEWFIYMIYGLRMKVRALFTTCCYENDPYPFNSDGSRLSGA